MDKISECNPWLNLSAPICPNLHPSDPKCPQLLKESDLKKRTAHLLRKTKISVFICVNQRASVAKIVHKARLFAHNHVIYE